MGVRLCQQLANIDVLSTLSRLVSGKSGITHNSACLILNRHLPGLEQHLDTVSLQVPDHECNFVLILAELRAALGLFQSQQASTDSQRAT